MAGSGVRLRKEKSIVLSDWVLVGTVLGLVLGMAYMLIAYFGHVFHVLEDVLGDVGSVYAQLPVGLAMAISGCVGGGLIGAMVALAVVGPIVYCIEGKRALKDAFTELARMIGYQAEPSSGPTTVDDVDAAERGCSSLHTSKLGVGTIQLPCAEMTSEEGREVIPPPIKPSSPSTTSSQDDEGLRQRP